MGNLATIPLSDGGIAPSADVIPGEITTITVNQQNKTDGMMEGVYYGYFFDQWPWKGGSGGFDTTLGPNLNNGVIYAEIDVCVEKAEVFSGRLRFSLACAIWKNRGEEYNHTEYDFWNGPQNDSGLIWTDTVRILKGAQFTIGEWNHLKLNLSSLISETYGMNSGFLQAVYAVIEWDGNNSAMLKFREFRLYTNNS